MNNKISRENYGEHSIFRVSFNKLLCLLAKLPMPTSLRIFLYSLTGMKIGKNVFIAAYVHIDDQYPELIELKDHVTLAYKVTLITHDDSRGIVAPIIIQNNTFIGACSTILPGITINEHSTVGAGTIVSKDVPSNTIAVSGTLRFIQKDVSQDT